MSKPPPIPEPDEKPIEETQDYELIVETFVSQRDLTGLERGYAIRHKTNLVVESRHHAYAEAIQMLPITQENYDRHLGKFKRDTRSLH